MMNGIFDSSTGGFLPVSSRSRLRDDEAVQALLKHHHRKSNLHCGCGLGQAPERRLIPVAREGGMFTLSRQNIEDHPSECFLWLDGDDRESVKKRSPGILAPIKPAGRKVPSRDAAVTSRTQYEEFARYARGILSRGLSRAFIARNARAAQWSNPTTAEVLRAIGESVSEFPFSQGGDGYAVATQMSCTLGFGILADPMTEEDNPCPTLSAYWWNGGGFSVQLTGVHAAAFAPALGSLRMIAHHRAPPYFFLGVQDGDGWIQRLFVHQVAVEESFLLPSDSGAECVHATELARGGHAVLKPVLIEDIALVFDAFGISLNCDLSQFHRPDYFVFGGTPARPALRIEELRGFRVGEDPGYDAGIEMKCRDYQQLRSNVPLESVIIDGTRLRWRPEGLGPENWSDTSLSYAAPTRTLFADPEAA